MKYLVIDATTRDNSRTKKLYKEYLKRLNGDINIINLYDLNIKPLNKNDIIKRDNLLLSNNYNDPMLALANDFVTYDEIIIAAPYWDLSFPSILKVYFENISVVGITFHYENGLPKGLAKAKRFIYFSTCGGPIFNHHLGYEYTKELLGMFGIHESYNCYIDSLDVDPNKEEELLNSGINRILKQLGF